MVFVWAGKMKRIACHATAVGCRPKPLPTYDSSIASKGNCKLNELIIKNKIAQKALPAPAYCHWCSTPAVLHSYCAISRLKRSNYCYLCISINSCEASMTESLHYSFCCVSHSVDFTAASSRPSAALFLNNDFIRLHQNRGTAWNSIRKSFAILIIVEMAWPKRNYSSKRFRQGDKPLSETA